MYPLFILLYAYINLFTSRTKRFTPIDFHLFILKYFYRLVLRISKKKIQTQESNRNKIRRLTASFLSTGMWPDVKLDEYWFSGF